MIKPFIKKIIPASFVSSANTTKVALKKKVLGVSHRTRFLSDFHYFVSNDFSNEHQAVLKGRKAYYDSLNDIGKSCALLRRNIHRLEKGLIMKPRRDVFGEGFIQETVDCYREAVKSTILATAEKKWATDVLDEYFKIVGSTPKIDQARDFYEKIRLAMTDYYDINTEFPSGSKAFKPYTYSNLPSTSIEFSEIRQLFIRRRSVRWYQDKPVPLDLVQKASNIASFAPSACNRQPYRFIFCNEKERTVAIAKCAMGTVGFSENLPAIIAIVGDLSAYPFERDRHVIYIDGSLAAMQLMLALETLGLSTCPINWPEIDANERKLRNVIKLKDYERVVMLLAVGYAEDTGGIPYSQKKENNLILEDISK
ncbi:Nitroreductase [Psychrobacter pacificensis]|uniref:Nitroreductase n=1 Tax=Psychrobacter pacificensis TaxID=112002 RepID=A0A1G6YZR7_9GAMM|nr:nitroreductase family protein [Psychrobacter pacificensis]GLR28023.1 hypothetical protein GCM10007915_02610 [Psychrobacter pacificensis]SDD95135.1 Nitroreductase [Psychrobacter pacificensis]